MAVVLVSAAEFPACYGRPAHGAGCPCSVTRIDESAGEWAGPTSGYAERMLEYRLALGLPTVITIERYGLEMVNLRARTVHLLKQSKNVVLSRLSEEDRQISTMFR